MNHHPTPEYELARNAINSADPLAGNRLAAGCHKEELIPDQGRHNLLIVIARGELPRRRWTSTALQSGCQKQLYPLAPEAHDCSSFMQAFSKILVHFPLVPAWLCFRCCRKWSARKNFLALLHSPNLCTVVKCSNRRSQSA